jgi:hypothetical protein
MPPELQIVLAVVTPIAAAAGAYAAVKVELRFLWREVDAINAFIGRK